MTVVVALERELDQRSTVAFAVAAIEVGLDHDQPHAAEMVAVEADGCGLNRVEGVADGLQEQGRKAVTHLAYLVCLNLIGLNAEALRDDRQCFVMRFLDLSPFNASDRLRVEWREVRSLETSM